MPDSTDTRAATIWDYLPGTAWISAGEVRKVVRVVGTGEAADVEWQGINGDLECPVWSKEWIAWLVHDAEPANDAAREVVKLFPEVFG